MEHGNILCWGCGCVLLDSVDPVERKSKVVIRYSKFVARLSAVTVSPQSVPAQWCRCVTQSKTVMASHSTSRLSHCVSWNIPSWASKENLSHTEFHVWGEARPFYSRAPAGSSTPSPTSPMSRLWSRPQERSLTRPRSRAGSALSCSMAPWLDRARMSHRLQSPMGHGPPSCPPRLRFRLSHWNLA